MKPGDVVVGDFPAPLATKTRPAVVLATDDYESRLPDVVVGLITSQVPDPIAPTDCDLRDWRQAGLHAPSFFRLIAVTVSQRDVRLIGRLSARDWADVRSCMDAGACGD